MLLETSRFDLGLQPLLLLRGLGQAVHLLFQPLLPLPGLKLPGLGDRVSKN